MMRAPQDHLSLPFFDAGHRDMATRLQAWAAEQTVDERDDRTACRDWVRRLGNAGWLRYCVPAAYGGALPALDSRALVLARETLAYHSTLGDFAFAMQGLGSGAITLAGTPEQRAAYLPAVARGDKIAAFALSESQAGSDAGAINTIAACATNTRPSDQFAYEIQGEKTWISNGGLADFYVLFAKMNSAEGGISAFIVDKGTEGLDDSEAIAVMSPHPLATLKLRDCRLNAKALLGVEGQGFQLAMRTLDIFRASVAGAALGFARRALHEARQYAQQRSMFGKTLADMQLTQAKLGEMAALVDAGALLTYRAAWLRDTDDGNAATHRQLSAHAAMAKLTATENAQRVIDMALQMHGGQGVRVGSKVEALYRDIRALRIYEGASEVQQLILGKAVLQGIW